VAGPTAVRQTPALGQAIPAAERAAAADLLTRALRAEVAPTNALESWQPFQDPAS